MSFGCDTRYGRFCFGSDDRRHGLDGSPSTRLPFVFSGYSADLDRNADGVSLGVVSGILVWTGYQGFDEQRTLQLRRIRNIEMRYYLTCLAGIQDFR